MARKNLLANITEEKLTAVNSGDEGAGEKAQPVAYARHGALGTVSRAIDDLAAKADTARQLEARLAAGEIVVELDPDSIGSSFISDRLASDDDAFQSLVEAMKERGQDTPILVRVHPDYSDRYQVAFGHRRVQAAKLLGRKVRAVVKPLSDRDLVLAQGQENSARADLSFIERALFAHRLEVAGFDRETIMSALSVDKTVVSRMLSVLNKLSHRMIEAIGAAPNVGRDRWIELATASERAGGSIDLDDLIASSEFKIASSNDRFEMITAAFARRSTNGGGTDPTASNKVKPSADQYWTCADGQRVARVKANDKAFVMSIDQRIAPNFGAFLLERMDRLYAEFSAQTKESGMR